MSSDSLGDRMKSYEAVFKNKLVPRTPVMIRLDGRAFHTLTRNMVKPFDNTMIKSMELAAIDVMSQIQGAKIAYVQSDEVSIAMTDYDSFLSDGWFGYNHSKIVSISSSLMSVRFAHYMKLKNTYEVFDSRAFSIPADDIGNAFLWRAQDWARNSLQMYARANFTHSELHKKNQGDMHEMLHGIGKNWTTDLTGQEKNGVFLVKTPEGIISKYDVLPTFESINEMMGTSFDYPN